MMKLPIALSLAAAGAVIALSAPPAEAADPPAVCDPFKGRFDRGTWTAANAGDLRALERSVPLACSDLRTRISARVDLVYREPRGQQAPGQCPPGGLVDPILAGADARAVRGLRDSTRETCPTVYRQAVAWLERRGGRATALPLVLNDPLQGEISGNDHEVETLRYDPYRIRLRPGERVAVTMRSEAFPPLLAVVTGTLPTRPNERGDFEVIGSESYDELPHGGVRLVFTAPAAETTEAASAGDALPEAQEYIVIALSRERERTGAYTIEQHAPPPPEPPAPLPVPRPVVFETTVQSAITEASPALRNRGSNTYYEPWGFHGAAGEAVRIYMGAEYDAYLSLGRIENNEFVEVAENDDAGEGVDSLILYRLQEEGDYVIRARALGGHAGGPYDLTVQRLAPQQREHVPDNANAWMLPGTLLGGEGSYQEFEFRPRRNRRYVVSIREVNFLAALDLGLALRGTEVRELDFYAEPVEEAPADPEASADPAATLAEPAPVATAPNRSPTRLEFRAEERRPYVIRVRSRDGGAGDFQVMITEIE